MSDFFLLQIKYWVMMKERVIVYLQTREKDRYTGKNSNIILLEERVGKGPHSRAQEKHTRKRSRGE